LACEPYNRDDVPVTGEIRFYSGVISVEPPLVKTPDGVPIRFFILKIIFRILVDLRGVRDQAAIAWVRHLKFSEFPIF
jgi:hypothetical protein